MRGRLTLFVAATTSAVVLTFLIPIALLLHNLAETRAVASATSRAQNLAAVAAATGDGARLADLLDPGADGRTTVVLPDGSQLGHRVSDPRLERARAGEAFTVDDGHDDVVVYVPAVDANGAVTVVRVEVTEAELHRGIGRATAILAALGLLLLIAVVVFADALARTISSPVRELADAADALREGRLEVRTAERGPAELVALARALNRLAARIGQLLVSEREAVADLSHRLRTPVTALRLDADAVTDPELAERLREHVDQLQRTVDAVVRDARRPVRQAVGTRCDATAVVAERVTFWSALADDQGRPLGADLPALPLPVRIDPVELTDVVDVLIDNVFAHTAEGVALHVGLYRGRTGGAVLTVADAGPGFPAGDQVLQRGRSGAGSTGLGLDIARRAAVASGGSLTLGRSQLGGALVTLELGPAEVLAHRRGLRAAARTGTTVPTRPERHPDRGALNPLLKGD